MSKGTACLPADEAKLRKHATIALGRAARHLERAFHEVLYNRKGRARRQIATADKYASLADCALLVWQHRRRRRRAA